MAVWLVTFGRPKRSVRITHKLRKDDYVKQLRKAGLKPKVKKLR